MKPMDKARQKELVDLLENAVKKYGFQDFRRVANRYLKTARLRSKAQIEIRRLEREMERLRRIA